MLILASFHMQCQAQETRVSAKGITPALGEKIKISCILLNDQAVIV